MPEDARGLIQYENVPRTIAAVVSGKLATLHELSTVYSVQDMWWLLEIYRVNNHNKSVMSKPHGASY